MSEENVEIVRKAFAYEYLDRGGRADAATYFTADFQMNPIEGFGDEELTFGRNAIRQNFGGGRAPGRALRSMLRSLLTPETACL